jgi:hypothetical protein
VPCLLLTGMETSQNHLLKQTVMAPVMVYSSPIIRGHHVNQNIVVVAMVHVRALLPVFYWVSTTNYLSPTFI